MLMLPTQSGTGKACKEEKEEDKLDGKTKQNRKLKKQTLALPYHFFFLLPSLLFHKKGPQAYVTLA